MKYCKKCGVLYSDVLGVCPKCGMQLQQDTQSPAPKGTKAQIRRQWIALIIGIPALICLLYVCGWILRQVGAF